MTNEFDEMIYMELTDKDFQRLVTFMSDNFGINLSRKRQLIVSRLSSSLEAMGYTTFTPFIDDLIRKKDAEKIEMTLNKLTTNYTFFMREKEHYDFFMKVIMPDITQRNSRTKTLAIWSAGCSTGEEPYNISMCIKEYLGKQASMWDTRVLATDISQRALTAAQNPKYELTGEIPAMWREKYFKPLPSKEGKQLYTVAPMIRNNVIFRTFNLMDPIRFRLKFDVIFCRNVMIYFSQETKDALVERFYNASKPGGYLLIGHSESIGTKSRYQTLRPSTFRRN